MSGVLAILLALALLAPVAARAGGPEPSADEMRRLEAGEIVTWTWPAEGRSVPWMKASGLVAAPPAAVWPIIDECARYADTMPSTVESAEHERRGDHVSCRGTGDLPFPFSDLETVTDAVHMIEPGNVYRREWKQRSGDFEVNEGRWTLVPWRDGSSTLATYEALTDPKIALPGFIVRWATGSVLPAMIATLREQTKARRERLRGQSPTR